MDLTARHPRTGELLSTVKFMPLLLANSNAASPTMSAWSPSEPAMTGTCSWSCGSSAGTRAMPPLWSCGASGYPKRWRGAV